MTLRRWDIVFLRADEKDESGHPAVVLSHEDILEHPQRDRFNVLLGSKKGPAYPAQPRHVTLDQADGLEFVTLVDCSLLLVGRKSGVLRRAGMVSHERRREIQRKLRAFLGLG